ncbi:hypothetical protein [Metabacillus niabensis]|uniref:hypothetical protein n=1 Tax=Metabacillus niabensis TaxID=324854 RepID=UPI0039A0C99F
MNKISGRKVVFKSEIEQKKESYLFVFPTENDLNSNEYTMDIYNDNGKVINIIDVRNLPNMLMTNLEGIIEAINSKNVQFNSLLYRLIRDIINAENEKSVNKLSEETIKKIKDVINYFVSEQIKFNKEIEG